ncbi:hypothetical protein FGB62_331g05 [Gracilaria domingensis]|nr:hypothetical protein FGB62_331g05 [Gracilaria domingensis]
MMGVIYLCYRVKKSSSKEVTWRAIIVNLLFGNVLQLRNDLVDVVRYIPFLWFVMVRHILPPLLLVLFANLATADDATGRRVFAHYEGYQPGYQALGLAVFLSACVVILVGAVFPGLYACFDMSDVLREEALAEAEQTPQVDGKLEEAKETQVTQEV